MVDSTHNTKRIVKNTIVLYARMIVTMIISLYSSRIVLQALGINDYGLYNVIGGVVALLTFLKSTLTSSTQRFLSYEMGTGNLEKLKAVFSMSITTHLLISLFLVVLAETVGLWFLNTQIAIPDGRESAANWVYQFTVLSLVFSLLSVPYNADIISRERMTFYAVVSIGEALLKLLFAFLLLVVMYDVLILYAALMCLVSFIVLLAYWGLCRAKYDETRYQFFFDKAMFKRIFGFSAWTLIGQMAVVAANQGTAILVNIYHSVAANAAMGVGQQVNGAITGLTGNFQSAFQPQITKSYAAKDYDYLNNLICYTSKISFFLLFVVTLPIILNIDIVLGAWLVEVPKFSGEFCNLFLIASMFNAISAPLWIAVYATGEIKDYQMAVSAVFFSDVVFVYVLFRLGMNPTSAMYVKAIINFFVIFVRLFFTQKNVKGFSASNFMKKSLIPICLSTILTLIICVPLSLISHTLWEKALVSIIIFLITLINMYYVGLNIHERVLIKKYLVKINRHT